LFALFLEYQVKGYGGVKVDFLVNDMIVDTKYKPKYRNKTNNEYKYQIEDIRKLSGYDLLLGRVTNPSLPCAIIFVFR
jgi:5-methylcytosine-specific restriction endonuclease McrBC regulatory subunit McrC